MMSSAQWAHPSCALLNIQVINPQRRATQSANLSLSSQSFAVNFILNSEPTLPPAVHILPRRPAATDRIPNPSCILVLSRWCVHISNCRLDSSQMDQWNCICGGLEEGCAYMDNIYWIVVMTASYGRDKQAETFLRRLRPVPHQQEVNLFTVSPPPELVFCLFHAS